MAQTPAAASLPTPNSAHSGAAMDRRLPQRSRWRRLAPWMLAAAAGLLAGTWLLWHRASQLPLLTMPQLARVSAGEFRDELALRARVEPLRSVQLDSSEAGQVEAVLVQDGDWVQAGAPLYRLHSPEQEQLLMQRSAEVAQQLANVAVARSTQVASLAQNRRELAQLQAAQLQAGSDYQRIAKLASGGFVSAASLEQAQRQQQLTSQLYKQAQHDQRLEADTRQQSLEEMARAVQGLQHGLQLLESARDRLQQRAPIAGRLSGFQLQVGSAVRLGDRLGRIDDPSGGVQLTAEVDEYYLPRLQTGQGATSGSGSLTLAQTLPQVHDGKVRVLLRWAPGTMPPADLRAGQAVDVRVQLSPPARALLLPEGPGVQAQIYVRHGDELQRRSVQLGRRAAGQVEVLAGLQVGEEVLISQPPSGADRFALP